MISICLLQLIELRAFGSSSFTNKSELLCCYTVVTGCSYRNRKRKKDNFNFEATSNSKSRYELQTRSFLQENSLDPILKRMMIRSCNIFALSLFIKFNLILNWISIWKIFDKMETIIIINIILPLLSLLKITLHSAFIHRTLNPVVSLNK